jgi:multidrug efflux pump
MALIISIAGVISITRLPISQYPITSAPPAVTISAVYPGAAARTAEESVTQIIEQAMTGLDGLIYMSSTSDSYGGVNITLTFASGTDPDIAQVQAQNKLQLVTPLLPGIVQQYGLNVTKQNANFLMGIGFISEDNSMRPVDVADYLATNVIERINRLPGVGSVQLFGSKYAMRIWLDPDRLKTYSLQPSDIIAVVRRMPGVGRQLGDPPSVPGQQPNATIIPQAGCRRRTVRGHRAAH